MNNLKKQFAAVKISLISPIINELAAFKQL